MLVFYPAKVHRKKRYEAPTGITCAVFISSNIENLIKELMDTKSTMINSL